MLVPSVAAPLIHWIDNLAGSSRGKTIRTYRRYWQERFGPPGEEERVLLQRWRDLRVKPVPIAQGEPRNADGCLPQIDDPPGWRQIFLLRSYDAPSVEVFLDSLEDHLNVSEIGALRRAIGAFEPRFAQVWREMAFLQRFEKRFRRYIQTSDLRPFLGEVARFLGVEPSAFPAGRIHLMALPGDASAIGRHLMMEVRPGDGPEEQIQVIAHETTHYLWQMMAPGRKDRLARQLHEASPAGPAVWALLHEGLPTAIGQGLSEARLAPRRFGLQYSWYHTPLIDRFAKEIYTVVEDAIRHKIPLEKEVITRIARSRVGMAMADSPPGRFMEEVVHVLGEGIFPVYMKVTRETPARHRWLFPASDRESASFLRRYRCLSALIMLGPSEAAAPSRLPEGIRPPPGAFADAAADPADQDEKGRVKTALDAGLRSGIHAVRRQGGGVLFYLVAASEADIQRVAERFLSLRRIPDGPVLLDPSGQ
jgi:hypothetical protein